MRRTQLSRPTFPPQRAQAMVEFALTAMVFLLALLMILEVSRLMQAYITVQHAARMGARYAVSGQSFNFFVEGYEGGPGTADDGSVLGNIPTYGAGWLAASNSPMERIRPCRPLFYDDPAVAELEAAGGDIYDQLLQDYMNTEDPGDDGLVTAIESAITLWQPYRSARTCSVEYVVLRNMVGGLPLNPNATDDQPGYYYIQISSVVDDLTPQEGEFEVDGDTLDYGDYYGDYPIFDSESGGQCIGNETEDDPAQCEADGYTWQTYERGLASGFGGYPQQAVYVQIEYRVGMLTPLFQPIVPNGVEVTGLAVLQNEAFGNTGLQREAQLPPEMPEVPELEPPEEETPDPDEDSGPEDEDEYDTETDLIAPGSPDTVNVTVIDEGAPAFQWRHLPDAQWYKIWITDISTRPDRPKTVYRKWIKLSKEPICDEGTLVCTTVLSRNVLKLGVTYTWTVQPYTRDRTVDWTDNKGLGPWYEPQFLFEVQLADLISPVLTAPINGANVTDYRPTLTWNRVNNSASYFYLLVREGNKTVIKEWIRAADVCTDLTCEYRPLSSLRAGSHSWQIQAWNPAGDIWSTLETFNVDMPALVAPGTPELVSPVNGADDLTDNPVPLVWEHDPLADYYLLQLRDPRNKYVVNTWFHVDEICGDPVGLCTYEHDSVFAGGVHRWTVTARNTVGQSPKSAEWLFGIPASANPLAPPQVTLVKPLGETSESTAPTYYDDYNAIYDPDISLADPASPIFVWERQPTAERYRLYILDVTADRALFDNWIEVNGTKGRVADCSSGALCLEEAPVLFRNGDFRWWIQPWNDEGGYGEWSEPLDFTVISSSVGLVPPDSLSPSGDVDSGTPIAFQWSNEPGNNDGSNSANKYEIEITGGFGVFYTGTFNIGSGNNKVACGAVGTFCILNTDTITLPSGSYSWRVRAVRSSTPGPWSQPASLVVRPANQIFTPLYVNFGASATCDVDVLYGGITWVPEQTFSSTASPSDWGVFTGAGAGTYNFRDTAGVGTITDIDGVTPLSPGIPAHTLYACRVLMDTPSFIFMIETPSVAEAVTYRFSMLMAETFFSSTNQRRFNIGYGLGPNPVFTAPSPNNVQLAYPPFNNIGAGNFDIVSAAGGANKAVIVTLNVTAPPNTDFVSLMLQHGSANNPMISALAVEQN